MGIRQRQYFCPRCKRPTLWMQYVQTLGDARMMFEDCDWHCQTCGEGQPKAGVSCVLVVALLFLALSLAFCAVVFVLAGRDLHKQETQQQQPVDE